MKLSHLLSIGLVFLTLCLGCDRTEGGNAMSEPVKAKTAGTIVAVGDSLTAGFGVPESESYPALLEKKLHEAGYRWQVINAGISGETSSGTLARIEWILKLKPDIVILETGANDGLRGSDPKLLRENLDRIVAILQKNRVSVILAGMKMFQNLGASYTHAFANAYRETAAKYNLILIPFFLENVAGEASLNQRDGLHPTASGYRTVTATVYPYVVQAIKQKQGSK